MSVNTHSNYPRIIVRGTLTTQSNLHIGTGLEGSTNEDETFNALCLDAKGNPYIPASSLRGYLRHTIASQAYSELERLFGLARQKTDAESTGNSGLLRLYDCRWVGNDGNTALISRTSIDSVTATAKHHHLSTHAVVPSQSQFSVHLELDNASLQHLQAILQALQTLGEINKGKLGQGKSIGQAEMHWQQGSVRVLTQPNLIKWLTQNTVKQNKPGAYKKSKPEKKLQSYYCDGKQIGEVKALVDTISPYPHDSQSLEIRMVANSPLLINDPQSVKKRTKEAKAKEKENPELKILAEGCIYKIHDKLAILPGSTLKGWARARVRRIVLTIIDNHTEINVNFTDAEYIAESLLQEMFGSTATQGCLSFNNAQVTVEQQDIHQQTFNAIDRFTGGVKPGVKGGALYKVEALWPESEFVGQVLYQTKQIRNWMKLLLLYLIKDCMQDDLVLGWGKSKGYGRLRLSLLNHPDWESLYDELNIDDLQQWDNDLQQVLKAHTEKLNEQ